MSCDSLQLDDSREFDIEGLVRPRISLTQYYETQKLVTRNMLRQPILWELDLIVSQTLRQDAFQINNLYKTLKERD